MLHKLPISRYTYRTYIVSSGDEFSAEKAHAFEKTFYSAMDESQGYEEERMRDLTERKTSYSVYEVPRARAIYQSLLTTPLSSLSCLFACLRLLVLKKRGYPDIILTNGPATALIMLLAVKILRCGTLIGLPWRRNIEELRSIYVESWARVKTPSLSLKIIGWTGLCDKVLVQHRPLAEKGWGEWRSDLMH